MESTRSLRTPMVGREFDLEALRSALAGAAAGRGQLLLLAGEPGIGKTRLAEEAETIARAAALRVLWGRCREIEGRPPFFPWVQVLRGLARSAGAASLSAEIDSDLAPLAQLVPELSSSAISSSATSTALDSESARFRLFHSVAALLGRLAGEQPILLVLDDLQWADLPSLRLLEFLSYELDEMPVVVVGTYRDLDSRMAPAAGDIIGGLLRRAHAITLSGFTTAEVASFVAAVTSRPVSQAVATRLRDATDGNPFFLDEMVRLLQSQGVSLPSPASGWPLPQGVLATIRSRLAPLPPETLHLLAVGAIAGREFDVALLEPMLGTPRKRLIAQLDAAAELGIVRPIPDRPGRLRFAHALVRDAIREGLAASERSDLHRKWGEALEARHASSLEAVLPELAYHFSEAAPHGGEAKALGYSERAGAQAMEALAYEEAASHFTRARHLIELTAEIDSPRHCEIMLRLGEACNRASHPVESVAAFQRAAEMARRIGSSLQLARAALGLSGVGSTWAQYGRYDSEIVAVLHQALDGLPAAESALRARLMARLGAELHWAVPPVDNDAITAEAVSLARQSENLPTLAYALAARLRCARPDAREERLAIIDEIVGLTRGRGDLAVYAYVWRLSEALQAGELPRVIACREALLAAVRELRQPRDQWLIPVLQSQQFVLEGQIAEADRAADAVFALENLTVNAQMAGLVLLFLVRREQGRLGELTEALRAFAYRSETVTAWRTTLASVYAETGDEAAARAELEALVRDDISWLRRDNTWMLAVAVLAAATAIVGRPEQAAMVYRALQPHDGRNVVAGSFFYFGPVSYYLGILAARQGLRDVALAHLAQAEASARRLGAQPFVARALLARAQTIGLDPLGDSQTISALRREAADIAAGLDLRALSEIARSEAPATDERRDGHERTADLFRRGDAWVLTYRGRNVILKARRGMDHLARLLAAPGQEMHVLDLARQGGAALVDSTADVLLDPRAKRELRLRLDDLRATLAEAEEHNDFARAEQARSEIEAIGEHLSQAMGLGGRDRLVNTSVERARAAVTKAIRAAIRQIQESEPDLAALLTRTVRTGTFCRYAPLSEAAITWTIRSGETGAS